MERECWRNLELIWLTGRLKPDFKTIADFRKDNGPAIRKVCQQFVALCRNMDLLDGDVVAIDGSRFKAVNSKAKNFTRGKLSQKLGEIDKAIERYLGELDRADEVFEQTGTVLPEARMERTLRKLNHLQKEAVRYRSIEQRRMRPEKHRSHSATQTPDRWQQRHVCRVLLAIMFKPPSRRTTI